MEKKYKVFYQGSLYGHFGRDRAGKEIAVNKSFTWGGEEWLVPSVYFCGKGLVADMFKKVSVDSFREFIEKFGLDENSDCDGFSDEQQAEIEAENPLNSDIFASIQFGGRKSDMEFSSADCWNPLFPDSGDAAEALLGSAFQGESPRRQDRIYKSRDRKKAYADGYGCRTAEVFKAAAYRRKRTAAVYNNEL